jgi:Rad3-related DNA helicase
VEAAKEIWNRRGGDAGHAPTGMTSAHQATIATSATLRPENLFGSLCLKYTPLRNLGLLTLKKRIIRNIQNN